MTTEPILHHDLTILETMVTDVADYLDSNATHWTLSVPEMPKLTLGGCLLRLHRLDALQSALSEEERGRLATAVATFDSAASPRIVRFEERAHQELHARLSEWCSYLRHMKNRAASHPDYYARVVDTRVVITMLIDKLSQQPYQLEERARHNLNQFDSHLQQLWVVGDFVWDPIWQPAYPTKPFWYLFGNPRWGRLDAIPC